MRIERSADGDFILESAEIAHRFGVAPEELRRSIRQGLVASRVERGEGEHAGTCRLSVRIGNRAWKAVLREDDGQVQSETMTFVRSRTGPGVGQG